MEVRNPRYNNLKTIDCEINHPELGWIPFTATPDDQEELGKLIYQEMVDGTHGDIAPYIPPDPVPDPVPQRISPRQARLQLIRDGKFAAVKMAIESLPDEERLIAETEWEYATFYDINNPFMVSMSEIVEIDLEDFFTKANKL